MDHKLWRKIAKVFLIANILLFGIKAYLYFFLPPSKLGRLGIVDTVCLVGIRCLIVGLSVVVLYDFINSAKKRSDFPFFLLFLSALVLDNLHEVSVDFLSPIAILLVQSVEIFLLFFAVIVISRRGDKIEMESDPAI